MAKTLASLLAVGLAIVSTGCPGTGDGEGGGSGTVFGAQLTGDQEVPAVVTDGDGVGAFNLSEDETVITFAIDAGALSGPVTAAHFHQGAEGVDGDIVIDIGADVTEENGEVSVEGSASANAAFVEALRNGDIYVNLHTELNPGGEIRGQLEATPPTGE